MVSPAPLCLSGKCLLALPEHSSVRLVFLRETVPVGDSFVWKNLFHNWFSSYTSYPYFLREIVCNGSKTIVGFLYSEIHEVYVTPRISVVQCGFPKPLSQLVEQMFTSLKYFRIDDGFPVSLDSWSIVLPKIGTRFSCSCMNNK